MLAVHNRGCSNRMDEGFTGRTMDIIDRSYSHRKDNRQLDNIPGSYGWPLIGDTIKFAMDPYTDMHDRYNRHGPVSKMSLTMQRFVLALGPEFIQQLTLDPDQSFSSRMGYDGPMGDFFAGGLLLKDFDEHKFHRRIMQSSFKIDSMRGYVEQMNPVIDRQLDKWQVQSPLLFYPHVKSLLLDVGARVFLGMDLLDDETRDLNHAFMEMNEGIMAIIRKDWPGLLYRRGMNGRRQLEQFFHQLVPQRRGAQGTDMATRFSNERTEEGDYFSDSTVANHLIFLLLAAHDTTTSALTMAMYYLAHDQQWQQRLRDEVSGTGERLLQYEDLSTGVADIENTFLEVLRLNPPVPVLVRRTVKPVAIGGFELPVDTLVQVSPLYVQRMEQWWREPQRFDPDRFNRAEHKQHNFLWTPFGGGAHKCIGMHFANMLFKCTLGAILQRYRFEFASTSQYPGRLQHFPFARPLDKLPLRLTRL
jgi:cytochrome P450